MSNNGYNGEYIFSTTDPLGRTVRLKLTTWNYHITSGDHSRTEFNGEEELIRSVIEDPGFILNNNPDDENCTRQKYIDLVDLKAFTSLKNLVIVVDHEHEIGDIVTIIAKSKVNQESTKGGVFYARNQTTNK